MGLIRGELEDLAFRYLESDAFFELQKKVASKQNVFDKFLGEVQESRATNGSSARSPGRVVAARSG